MSRPGQRLLTSIKSSIRFLEWLASQLPLNVRIGMFFLVGGVSLIGFLHLLALKSTDDLEPQYQAQYQQGNYGQYQGSGYGGSPEGASPSLASKSPGADGSSTSQSSAGLWGSARLYSPAGQPSYWYRESMAARRGDRRFGRPSRNRWSYSYGSGAAQAALDRGYY